MSIGVIEKEDKEGFDLVQQKMFVVWDSYKGVLSAKAYLDIGLSMVRFLWDGFHQTKVKIGDGVGADGDVLWYRNWNDTHIQTALSKMWSNYLKERM